MKINSISNINFQNTKFKTLKPQLTSHKIIDNGLLLTRIPEEYSSINHSLLKNIHNRFDGSITEISRATYKNPTKYIIVSRSITNEPKKLGFDINYKKITEITTDKKGKFIPRTLVQTLKNGVYSSRSILKEHLSFDLNQDKFPKSVIGADKNEQVSYYTKQPKFFKKIYLKTLNRMITDKNGCEKLDSKIYPFISELINKNIEKEPLRANGFDDVNNNTIKPPSKGFLFDF